MRRVIVNIESLVLKGFRYEDRYTVAAAIEQELARVLASPAAAERLAGLGTVSLLHADTVRVRANTEPNEVGALTAGAIGKGLLTPAMKEGGRYE